MFRQELSVQTLVANYVTPNVSAGPGIPLNVAPGDVDHNHTSLGLRRSSLNNGRVFDIQLFTAQGFFQNMTLSFATNGNGNGSNGSSFCTASMEEQLLSLTRPHADVRAAMANFRPSPPANNAPLLVLRLHFSGGQSNGNDLQTIVDNIQINGTIVPEPTTIAGGLLGVLGLCWFQRRRLICCVRLRRT